MTGSEEGAGEAVRSGARGYSWAPFQPGHELSIKHGAMSPRKVEPIAAQYLEAALTDDAVPYLREPRYRPALVAWAQTEARVALIEAWVAGMDLEQATRSDQGRTPPLELLRRWEATAMTHRDRLGLTPASAARLSKEIAQTRQAEDVSQVMAELHRREAAAAEDAGGAS